MILDGIVMVGCQCRTFLNVGILGAGHEGNIAEPFETLAEGQFVEVGIAKAGFVSHGEHEHAGLLVHAVDKPHSRLDDKTVVVEVAEVRRAYCDEVVHSSAEALEVGKRSSDHDPA